MECTVHHFTLNHCTFYAGLEGLNLKQPSELSNLGYVSFLDYQFSTENTFKSLSVPGLTAPSLHTHKLPSPLLTPTICFQEALSSEGLHLKKSLQTLLCVLTSPLRPFPSSFNQTNPGASGPCLMRKPEALAQGHMLGLGKAVWGLPYGPQGMAIKAYENKMPPHLTLQS